MGIVVSTLSATSDAELIFVSSFSSSSAYPDVSTPLPSSSSSVVCVSVVSSLLVAVVSCSFSVSLSSPVSLVDVAVVEAEAGSLVVSFA